MKQDTKNLIIHPFLFAVYPLLFLFFRNLGKIRPSLILITITGILLIIFLLFKLLSFIFKNKAKAGLVISLCEIYFFFFRPLYRKIKILTFTDFVYLKYTYAVIIWSVIFILIIIFTIRKRAQFQTVTKIFNFVSILLIVFSSISLVGYVFENKSQDAFRGVETDNSVKKHTIESSLGKNTHSPDIYYIILDSYTSSDVLRRFYNFNNREFYEYLAEKGFYIAKRSHSNYEVTALSLSSSLNMEYITEVMLERYKKTKSMPFALKFDESNKLIDILESKGYKYINLGKSKYSDVSDDLSMQFERYLLFKYLLDKTLLYIFQDVYTFDLGYRRKIENSFEELAKIVNLKGPKFVFAYFMPPHPPFFVFGPKGEKFRLDKIMTYHPRQLYVYHISYINRKIKEVIDTILLKSEKPPIIILQGDHGCAIGLFNAWFDTNWLIQRMSVFNAYYLPGEGKKFLYDSITPVNTFRIILSYYFNEDYDLLRDESWFCHRGLLDKELINVTDKLKW